MEKRYVLLLLCLMLAASLRAQSLEELDEMQFDELLDVDVLTVSSRKPITRKQVPGNVTLFTQEEIANTGSRNLIDLLRLVPGLSFGMNAQNGVGLGVRGNWAQEGKALLVIDGIPVNENLFASMGHFFDYPVDQIQQLEVIRGPGASFYGGYAELAVVNIITKASNGYDGLELNASGGYAASGVSNRYASATGGISGNNTYVSANLFAGEYIRGESDYLGINGNTFDVFEGNVNRPIMAHTHIGYKGLKAQVMYRQDSGTYQEAYQVMPEPLDIRNRHLIGQLSYDWKANQKWEITPLLRVSYNQPWRTSTDIAGSTEDQPYDNEATRTLGSVTAYGELSDTWSTLSGVEFFVDHGFGAEGANRFGDNFNQSSITYTNIAAFSQQNLDTEWALFNGGLRFDYNSSFGSAIMPWLGANRQFGKLNVKLLYGYTFRAPTIENIRLSTGAGVEAERTRLVEGELGYQVSSNIFASLTVFDQKINSPVVFSVGPSNNRAYTRFGNSGSRGFETEIRYKKFGLGYLNLSYSFYASAHSQVRDFIVPGESGRYVGLATHKLNSTSSIELGRGFHLNPSLTFLGERLALVPDLADPNNDLRPSQVDPQFLLNLNIRKNDLLPGVDLTLSVMDLFDQQYQFVQPFNSLASPLPGMGREVLLSLSWSLN